MLYPLLTWWRFLLLCIHIHTPYIGGMQLWFNEIGRVDIFNEEICALSLFTVCLSASSSASSCLITWTVHVRHQCWRCQTLPHLWHFVMENYVKRCNCTTEIVSKLGSPPLQLLKWNKYYSGEIKNWQNLLTVDSGRENFPLHCGM